jgi:tetratricopeptide (TPR) repeat protein
VMRGLSDAGYPVGPAAPADPVICAAEEALRRGGIGPARRLLAGRTDAPAMVLLGICALREGDPRRAADIFAVAVARAPDDAVAHAYFALALVTIGEVARAEEVLDCALALAPASFVVRLVAAQCAYRLGLYPAAARRVEEALALGAPDADSDARARALLQQARARGGRAVGPGRTDTPLDRLIALVRRLRIPTARSARAFPEGMRCSF